MSMLTSIFYNTKPSVGGFVFDAVMRESHDYEADITTHPIEAGANIVDNVVIQPVILSLDIFVGSLYAITSFSIATGGDRPTDALTRLRQMQADRVPLTVVARLASYDNMLIRSINAHQDVDSSSSLLATITLQEAIIVDGTAGAINTNPADPQYSQPVKSGRKQGIKQ